MMFFAQINDVLLEQQRGPLFERNRLPRRRINNLPFLERRMLPVL
jgi:hypothetical protein